MQYEAKTPAEYLASLEKDWRREKLTDLRALIRSRAPELAEGINYKMLCYGDKRGNVFHLNAQKGSVNLYVGSIEKIDPDGSLRSGIDTGKGCLRFKKSLALSDTRIDEFVQRTIEMWRRGADMGPYGGDR